MIYNKQATATFEKARMHGRRVRRQSRSYETDRGLGFWWMGGLGNEVGREHIVSSISSCFEFSSSLLNARFILISLLPLAVCLSIHLKVHYGSTLSRLPIPYPSTPPHAERTPPNAYRPHTKSKPQLQDRTTAPISRRPPPLHFPLIAPLSKFLWHTGSHFQTRLAGTGFEGEEDVADGLRDEVDGVPL